VSGAAPVVVDAAPFDLGQGRDAALCIHGLTGTPYEVRPLGAALAASGIRALGPLLPGHGASPEALARVSHTEWMTAIRAAYRGLRDQHVHVYVVGLSLGGLLALWLAAQEDVDALVVVAVPLRLRSRLLPLLPLAKRVLPFVSKRHGSDIRDAAARARHPSNLVMPLASIQELVRMQHRVRECLGRVTAPILVAHGSFDATAHPDDAREIAGRVASPERELLWLPSSGHVVPVDYDGPALAKAVVSFLARPRHPCATLPAP
jgi:carboxylesterase